MAKASKSRAKDYDQFYTKDAVAKACLETLLREIEPAYDLDQISFLEPSAGDGAFLRGLEDLGFSNYYASDIDPRAKNIKKRDFLTDDLTEEVPDQKNLIVVGNPPFGHRARLAAAFINKALQYSGTIAFILPLQFEKYSAQSKLDPRLRLIYDQVLEPESFVYNGEKYAVRCCFQIWTRRTLGTDLRLRTSPVTKHADFEMWQYNNTREAEKYFNKDKYGWDFAVPRQGYKDYTLKETDPAKMDRHTQWIFFKANSREAFERLMLLDFEALSHKNTSVPGFGKADVIKEYEQKFGSRIAEIALRGAETDNAVLHGLPLYSS